MLSTRIHESISPAYSAFIILESARTFLAQMKDENASLCNIYIVHEHILAMGQMKVSIGAFAYDYRY